MNEDKTIMFFYFFNNKKMFKGFAKDILNLNLSNNIKLYKEKATYSDSRYGRADLLAVEFYLLNCNDMLLYKQKYQNCLL